MPRAATIMAPEDAAKAHFARAQNMQSQGQIREAAAAWLAGLETDPRHHFAHIALADTLLQLGLHDAAAVAGRQALMVDPDSADAHDRIGAACEALGDKAQAQDHYRRSLALRRSSPLIRQKLVALLRADGDLESACGLLAELACESKDAGVHFELGVLLSETERNEEAIQEFRLATQLRPRFPEALNNLGRLLRAAGELTEAERCYRSAVAHKPDFAPAWNNLANLYLETSSLKDADYCYSKAVTIDPQYAEAHTNRALLRLLQGRFADGWPEYEWRWHQSGMKPRTLPRPDWDGSDLKGKTILLHAEQGAGDTLQFIRYARLLKRQGASVILHCQESLKPLLSAMPELDTVIAGKVAAPPFDVHAPLMSLPRLLKTDLASIPAETPYLAALSSTTVPQPLLNAAGFKVGLVWAGNPGHPHDRNRSIDPELLSGLIQAAPGASFFSLQVGHLLPPAEGFEDVVDLGPHLTDYAVTAACLAHLDLLITVDTSVAHLAGALGRPVWTLLPSCNDWRWLEDRSDSPWYPTMRLFRQPVLGEWPTVIERVAAALVAPGSSRQTSIHAGFQDSGEVHHV
jgi:tetratricopeptide (TPR) repeat protein